MDGLGLELAYEWMVSCVYDKIERRFGRVAALLLTFLLAVILLGLIGAAAWYIFVA
jgi:hypothetical protein